MRLNSQVAIFISLKCPIPGRNEEIIEVNDNGQVFLYIYLYSIELKYLKTFILIMVKNLMTKN